MRQIIDSEQIIQGDSVINKVFIWIIHSKPCRYIIYTSWLIPFIWFINTFSFFDYQSKFYVLCRRPHPVFIWVGINKCSICDIQISRGRELVVTLGLVWLQLLNVTRYIELTLSSGCRGYCIFWELSVVLFRNFLFWI